MRGPERGAMVFLELVLYQDPRASRCRYFIKTPPAIQKLSTPTRRMGCLLTPGAARQPPISSPPASPRSIHAVAVRRPPSRPPPSINRPRFPSTPSLLSAGQANILQSWTWMPTSTQSFNFTALLVKVGRGKSRREVERIGRSTSARRTGAISMSFPGL